MYAVMKDSLFEPKKILNHRKRSGGFVFLYIVVLVLIMSIDAFVFYGGYDQNSVIDESTTGCVIDASGLSCGPSHDPLTEHNLYGFSVFLFDDETTVSDLGTVPGMMLVMKGESLTFYLDGGAMYSIPVDTSVTLGAFFASVSTGMVIASILVGVLSKAVILMFVILISTLPFLRLKRYIRYRKLFKLVVFATTPIAFLFTFYYLLNIPDLLFFLLMFLAYRSMYVMQKELYYRTMLHLQKQQQQDDDTHDDGDGGDGDDSQGLY